MGMGNHQSSRMKNDEWLTPQKCSECKKTGDDCTDAYLSGKCDNGGKPPVKCCSKSDDTKGGFMNDNTFLKDHIEELKEILELDEFPDLESRMVFAAHLGDCEDWLKTGEKVTIAPCSLCGGAGKFHEYDDEWVCHSCFGTGSSVYKA